MCVTRGCPRQPLLVMHIGHHWFSLDSFMQIAVLPPHSETADVWLDFILTLLARRSRTYHAAPQNQLDGKA